MLIRDSFRQQFYEVIKKEHVVILVAGDVDALCAYAILQTLLRSDGVVFSMVAISDWDQLEFRMRECFEQAKHIVLLNCGGGRSLADLSPPQGVSIYIVDSRRPFNVDNIYDGQNVKVLVHSDEWDTTSVPQVSDLYREEDSSDEELDLDALDAMSRERRMAIYEEKQRKRQARRDWEDHKKDLLWEYYENTWYSLSSSVMMLELAVSLGRGSAEMLWLAAVGLNSQYVDRLITLDAYTATCVDHLRPFIQRWASRNTERTADDLLRISFEKELPIGLYEHWSLMKAMSLDERFACRTQFWTQRGEDKLKELLAQLGLTLSECRQKWSAMSTERRKEVFSILEKATETSFASFHAYVGYSGTIGARDAALALASRLEQPAREKLAERLDNAFNALVLRFMEGKGNTSAILRYAEQYKVTMHVMADLVAQALNQSEILPAGPFFLFVSPKTVPEEITDSRHALFNFMQFLLKGFAAARPRAPNRSNRPLIVGLPLGGERIGWVLVSGIMPLNTVYHDTYSKSFIGRAFERVCELRTELRVQRNFFDTSVILVRSEDRGRFFDTLQAVLETSE